MAGDARIDGLPQRHGRPKQGKRREDKGPKIVVRLTADERARLIAAAGDRPLSTYVRQRLFGAGDGRSEAGDRTRDVYRKVTALHRLARKIDRLTGLGIDEAVVDGLVDDVRKAIESFVDTVPDPRGATPR